MDKSYVSSPEKRKAFISRFLREGWYEPARERLRRAREFNDGRGFMFVQAADEALDIADSVRRQYPWATFRNDNFHEAKKIYNNHHKFYENHKLGITPKNASGSVVPEVMPPQEAVESVLPGPQNQPAELDQPVNIEELKEDAKNISDLFNKTEKLLRAVYSELDIQFELDELEPIILGNATFKNAIANRSRVKFLEDISRDAILSIDTFIVQLEKKDHTIQHEDEKITSELNYLNSYAEQLKKYTKFFIQHYSEYRRGGNRHTRRKKKSKKTKKHRR